MTGPDLPLLSLDASFASFPSLAAITVLSGSQRLVIATGSFSSGLSAYAEKLTLFSQPLAKLRLKKEPLLSDL